MWHMPKSWLMCKHSFKKNFGSLGCECWLIFFDAPPLKKSKFGSCSIYSTHSWVPWGHGVHADVRLPEGKPHDFPYTHL